MTVKPRVWAELVDAGTVYHCDGASGIDFTLCGISLDQDQSQTRLAVQRLITCKACLGIVFFCRSISTTSLPKATQ